MTNKRFVVGLLMAVMFAAVAPAAWATGIGDITPMAIIPEPATGILLAIGGLMVLPRRRSR